MIQLAYVSTATEPMTDAALLALLEKARRKNFRRGVGGILLFHEGLFFQILEGKPADVDEIFAKIQTDPRHKNIRVLTKQGAFDRSFMDWRMGFLTLETLIQSNPSFTDALAAGADGFDSAFVQALVDRFRSGGMAPLVSDGEP